MENALSPRKLLKAAPGLEERLLRHVVRVLVVSDVAIAEAVHVALVAFDQLVEGLALASATGGQDLALVESVRAPVSLVDRPLKEGRVGQGHGASHGRAHSIEVRGRANSFSCRLDRPPPGRLNPQLDPLEDEGAPTPQAQGQVACRGSQREPDEIARRSAREGASRRCPPPSKTSSGGGGPSSRISARTSSS